MTGRQGFVRRVSSQQRGGAVKRPRGAENRRGAALFIVLMLCALLSTLAGAAMRTGLSGARAAAVFADAARADALGQSASAIVIHQLLAGDPEALRGGSLGVHLPDAEIAIDYVSESARVDVNAAPIGLITALLAAAGADPSRVNSVVARIRALRAEPGSATTTGTPPAAPQGAPSILTSPWQAPQAWDLPEDVARRILPALTVANPSKGVDPLLADRLVLSALLDGDDTRIDDYLQRRAQGFVNADAALALLPVPSRAFADFEDVPAVRAIVHVTLARRLERRYDMVVAPPGGPNRTPVVIEWRKLL